MTVAGIADLERRGLHAFAGLITEPIGEWFVVAGPYSARRANSVYPIGDPGRSLDAAVDLASEFLRSHGKPVLVKAAALPGDRHEIEPLLVARSFRPEAPTDVHTRACPADSPIDRLRPSSRRPYRNRADQRRGLSRRLTADSGEVERW